MYVNWLHYTDICNWFMFKNNFGYEGTIEAEQAITTNSDVQLS